MTYATRTNICSLSVLSHSAQIVIHFHATSIIYLFGHKMLRTRSLSDFSIIYLFSRWPQNFRLISFPHLISFRKYCLFFPRKMVFIFIWRCNLSVEYHFHLVSLTLSPTSSSCLSVCLSVRPSVVLGCCCWWFRGLHMSHDSNLAAENGCDVCPMRSHQ